MRRRNLLLIMAAAVLLSSLATWVATAQIRSPAEVAARTAPPDPTPILVRVKEQVLSTRVVTRGTAHFGSPRRILLAPSPLKSGAAIVTHLPGVGARVEAGGVLAEVSGRPVFVLEGSVPAYRDLGPGMSGPDVTQLEEALRGLGLRPGTVDGTYDGTTANAVARMYRRRGYGALLATEATLADARPAEAALVPGGYAAPGVQLPADEVVFVPEAPVRVSELTVPVGEPVDGPLLTVTGSDVVVKGLLPVEQAGRVHAGARVVVDEPSLGIDTVGRVAWVAGRAGTNGADGFHVAFEVAVDRPPAALAGASVRLTIAIRSTRTAQLTVPVSAVSLGPDGGSRVQKSAGGRTEFVDVQTGLSADGYVAVQPEQGDLTAGDRVVVGFRAGPRAGT